MKSHAAFTEYFDFKNDLGQTVLISKRIVNLGTIPDSGAMILILLSLIICSIF